MTGVTQPKTNEKEKSDSGLSSLMNFVPSAYYDLIARICPGMAFWFALSFKMPLLPGLEPAKALNISGPMLFILIVLSYVSGIVLTGFSVVWDWLSLICLSVTRTMRENLGLDVAKGTPFSNRWKGISNHIDSVIKNDAGAGRVLIKAMAEVTLCHNLLSGLFVLACVGHFSAGEHFYPPLNKIQFYAPIALALFISMVFRQAMFLGRVKELHEMYVTPDLSLSSFSLPSSEAPKLGPPKSLIERPPFQTLNDCKD